MVTTDWFTTLTQRALRASRVLFAAKQNADAILDRIRVGMAPSSSFSQHGEDLLACELLKDHLSDGFYVDVGANHPSKLSNTYKLYNLGMRGVVIEPDASFCGLHRRYRPGDCCVCAGMSSTEGVAWFFERGYHARSSLSGADAEETEFGHKVIRRRLVPIITLAGLLGTLRVDGRTDFCLLSVDCEGHDMEVLRGNDWARFRPRYLIVEFDFLDTQRALLAYLNRFGYRLERPMGCNMLFSRSDQRLRLPEET